MCACCAMYENVCYSKNWSTERQLGPQEVIMIIRSVIKVTLTLSFSVLLSNLRVYKLAKGLSIHNVL